MGRTSPKPLLGRAADDTWHTHNWSRRIQGWVRATGEKIIADCSEVVRQDEVEFDTKILVIESLGRHIYDAIEDEAKRWKADLIVIGTHGRRGFRRLLLGSITEGVIRVASEPVLLIRGA
jgi:nucleotide-binding universal stress UspA family protein